MVTTGLRLALGWSRLSLALSMVVLYYAGREDKRKQRRDSQSSSSKKGAAAEQTAVLLFRNIVRGTLHNDVFSRHHDLVSSDVIDPSAVAAGAAKDQRPKPEPPQKKANPRKLFQNG